MGKLKEKNKELLRKINKYKILSLEVEKLSLEKDANIQVFTH